MEGVVASFLPQKGFGFITGNDEKSYFFHQSDVASGPPSSIFDGASVTFDPTANAKGYKAVAVRIQDERGAVRFDTPSETLLSNDAFVRGWDTIQVAERWYLHVSGSGDPAAVKEKLRQVAAEIGGNGVVNVKYHKSTGQRGNYRFTIHNFIGNIVVVGRRKVTGRYIAEDFGNIDELADAFKADCRVKNQKGLAICLAAVLVALFVGAYLVATFSEAAIFPSLFLVVIAACVARPKHHGRWLKKM